MSHTPELLRVYFDQLQVPFHIYQTPAVTDLSPSAMAGFKDSPFADPYLKKTLNVKFKAEYPASADTIVHDYFHGNLGHRIGVRGDDDWLGSGVLAGLAFTVPTPLFEDDPYEVSVLLDSWVPNLIGRD